MSNIQDKISKLLRMANSDSEHEAALAAETAVRLATKYNLSLTETEIKKEGVTHKLFSIDSDDNETFWLSPLAVGIGKIFHCEVGRFKRDEMVFIGRSSDIETTIKMFQWISSQIITLRAKEKIPYGHYRRPFLKNFAFGCVIRILYRMGLVKEEEEKAGNNSIVRVKDSDNMEYIDENFGAIEKKTVKPGSGWKEGFMAGDKIQINDSVSDTTRKALL